MKPKQVLQQRSQEHLQGMCRKAGLDDSGSKSALIDRLLDPAGRVLPPAPTEPTEPTEPAEEPAEPAEEPAEPSEPEA